MDVIEVRSPEFEDGDPIPTRYSGDGDDASPPIEWGRVPPAARELVLFCEDPDAPQVEPFAHWLAYHIPPWTHSPPRRTVSGRDAAGAGARPGWK